MGLRSLTRPRPLAVLVPVTALAAGLLFATSAATARGTDLRADRRLQLTELIARERSDVLRQQQIAADLRAGVEAISASVAAADSRIGRAAPSDGLRTAAGLTALTGPGLEVTLDDAPRRTGRPVVTDPDDLVVHQQDLQSVVNALWSGGAEGVTLMGQRIVSTSAVRCVGNTVILHGRVYSPPFRIAAVGNQQGMQAALELDPGVRFFRTFVERFGLGYDVRTRGELALPAYNGTLTLPTVLAGAP